jgi:hypothetical protein
MAEFWFVTGATDKQEKFLAGFYIACSFKGNGELLVFGH